jgi:hypothetical protein
MALTLGGVWISVRCKGEVPMLNFGETAAADETKTPVDTTAESGQSPVNAAARGSAEACVRLAIRSRVNTEAMTNSFGLPPWLANETGPCAKHLSITPCWQSPRREIRARPLFTPRVSNYLEAHPGYAAGRSGDSLADPDPRLHIGHRQ